MTNKEKVLEYLKSGKTITAFEAFNLFRITSVRDYISFLRKDGHKIGDEWRFNAEGKKWKEYFMVPDEK